MGAVNHTVVLILTYWNVNRITISTPFKHQSFNLNLLECKFITVFVYIINIQVLILTYWNVNASLGGERLRAEQGFNLNLLECKLPFYFQFQNLALCFNLNLLECKCSSQLVEYLCIVVLILTYWNVNLKLNEFTTVLLLSFNLNLLECKLCITSFYSNWYFCFNLNLLECKF